MSRRFHLIREMLEGEDGLLLDLAMLAIILQLCAGMGNVQTGMVVRGP